MTQAFVLHAGSFRRELVVSLGRVRSAAHGVCNTGQVQCTVG